MNTQIYTNLKFVPFSELYNWSVQYIVGNRFDYSERFPLVRIGSFLSRNKTPIDIEKEKTYKRVTIKTNNGGVFLRDEEKGENIGTKKQFVISKGQFLLSKIDARNGAFGVVPDVADNAIITGNFWTFDVDYNQINPFFLSLITTTKAFINFSEKASNGTTNRHYLQEELFLDQKIPLPSLPEQNALIAAYNAKMLQATTLENQAAEMEANIENILFEMLGIKKAKTKKHDNKDGFLQMVRFKDITEWGVNLINKSYSINTEHINGKNLRLKDICSIGSGGTPSRSNSNYYKGNIPWVKTGEVLNDIINNTEEKITKEALDNSSAKIYPAGSLIIAMYGQGDTRGRTAKLGIEASTNQACAVLYNINRIVLVDYLWYYMQCNYHQLRSLASGNNQPNLNADKIKNYPVVIPPISIQDEIVTNISAQKEIIKAKKLQAEELRKEALTEFEKSIFE